jgi:CheY-like chemotaxis protein
VKFILTGSSVEAKFDIQKDLWNTIIDKDQINQVIGNIVLNAVQAMAGGGTIEIKADNIKTHGRKSIETVPEGEWVRISINDTGSGISKENLTKIYDPYFTTKKNGTGLGLAISYSIIKKHQGILKAESETGKGSTFFIYLPAFKGEAEYDPPQPLKLVNGKGRILYMDDEKTLCETVKDILSDLGYTVTTAYEGNKAVEIYKQAQEINLKFDLVILDLTVPGSMGGKETLGMLKQLDPEVRALATSGYSNDPIMANYSSFGFSGTIPKPFRIHDLAEIVKKNI